MTITSDVKETLIPIPIASRVLTQGTGGVSIFGLQFAKAAGARVIATTSSKEKGEKLKQLGADHVINYKEDSNWGETAKKLTGGSGVQHVIEVGGPNTVKQSLKAIAIDGVITIIGFLGGVKGEEPSFVECLNNVCTVRGVLVGSRIMFEQMNRAVGTLPGGIFIWSPKHPLIRYSSIHRLRRTTSSRLLMRRRSSSRKQRKRIRYGGIVPIYHTSTY